MKKILAIICVLTTIPAWSNNYCQEVFNKLVSSIGSSYGNKPTLTIVESDFLVAETYGTGEIKIGSRLIDLCRSFGADSSNAIAHVLSHELAHYYQNHAWVSNFTSAYASLAWSRNLSETEQSLLPVYETQADEMGFFYSLNAGFQTWKIASPLLDSIYKWYELPAELQGYPPLDQRKKITAAAKEKVTALVPLFHLANYFILIGKYFPGETQYVYYESAGYCLDHLVHENIKTPNVLNNLAVIYFLQAQPYLYEPLNKLLYPVVIDDNASSMDMQEMVGTKGNTTTVGELSPEALDLLEKAKATLTESLRSNKNYLAANLNLALVHFVMREEGALADRMKLISNLIPSNRGFESVHLQLEALSFYLQGDLKKMSDCFKKAIKLSDNSAMYNRDLLNKTKSSQTEDILQVKWPIDTTEKINDKRVTDFFKTYRSAQETRVDPYSQKFILWTEKKPGGIIYTFRSLFSQTIYRDMFFYEIEDLSFQTTHGLKLGMTSNELEKAYGVPYFKNISLSSEQFLYPSQSMIVVVDNTSQLISRIVYYGTKK